MPSNSVSYEQQNGYHTETTDHTVYGGHVATSEGVPSPLDALRARFDLGDPGGDLGQDIDRLAMQLADVLGKLAEMPAGARRQELVLRLMSACQTSYDNASDLDVDWQIYLMAQLPTEG